MGRGGLTERGGRERIDPDPDVRQSVHGAERAHEAHDPVLRGRVEGLRGERVQAHARRGADDATPEPRRGVLGVTLHVMQCEFHGCEAGFPCSY